MPLAGLAALRSLDCSNTQVADLTPRPTGLAALRSLDCSHTQVADLTPLANVALLQEKNRENQTQGFARLRCNGIADLAPLSNLTKLEVLDCAYAEVGDLSPLHYQTGLRSSRVSTRKSVILNRSSPWRPWRSLLHLRRESLTLATDLHTCRRFRRSGSVL